MTTNVSGSTQSAQQRYLEEVERRRREEIERRKREEEERKKAEAKKRAEEEKKAEETQRAEEQREAQEEAKAERTEKADDTSIFDEAEQDNGKYFQTQSGTTAKGSTTSETVDNLNETLAQRNEEEKATSTIHGMSDAEYQEYQRLMYEQYGITLENGYNYGHFQNVAVAMGESCSQGTRYSAMCKAAQSYDTVLDLVLDAKLQQAIADIFQGDTDPNWDRLCSSGNAGRLLKDYGIKIVKTGDRQYCFSLVDDNGNVIQDSEGHLAQVYKNDYLMPDGQCQQDEVHVSAALDAMGFDCWSVLDLSAEEYKMVKEMAQMDNSQLGTASRFKGSDELAIRNEVLGTYDKNTRTWSKAKKQDNSEWVNGTYVDKVSGETTGAKKRYSQFLKERDAGYYRGKSGYNGVPSGIEGVGGALRSGSGAGRTGNTNPFGTTDYNSSVAKYLAMGYSLSEAQMKAAANSGEVEETSSKSVKITQEEYNDRVTEFIYQGYNVEQAIIKANEELKVTKFEYTGRFEDLLKEA